MVVHPGGYLCVNDRVVWEWRYLRILLSPSHLDGDVKLFKLSSLNDNQCTTASRPSFYRTVCFTGYVVKLNFISSFTSYCRSEDPKTIKKKKTQLWYQGVPWIRHCSQESSRFLPFQKWAEHIRIAQKLNEDYHRAHFLLMDKPTYYIIILTINYLIKRVSYTLIVFA